MSYLLFHRLNHSAAWRNREKEIYGDDNVAVHDVIHVRKTLLEFLLSIRIFDIVYRFFCKVSALKNAGCGAGRVQSEPHQLAHNAYNSKLIFSR